MKGIRTFPALALLLLSASGLWGQETAVAVPVPQGNVPNGNVSAATLPSMMFGGGTSWNRGAAYPYAANTHITIRIGNTPWFSWTEVATPVANVPPGAPPLASTLTTGGAWVAARSASGKVSLIMIMQAGFSTIQATSTTSAAFTGSFGVAIQLGNSNIYAFPYIKAGNASTGGANGALATFIVQPGISILYGFGKPPTP